MLDGTRIGVCTRGRVAMVFVSVLTTTGCAHGVLGEEPTFAPDGYRHGTFPYRVARGPDRRILPPAWHIENFQTARGRPDLVLGPKRGTDYETTYHIDSDDDGVEDMTEQRFRYDLSYLHARTGAVLFLRTVPIRSSFREIDLRVFARRHADALAGAAAVTARAGSTLVSEEHRYSTRISTEQRARVHGQDAFLATIDVADVDQAQVWPQRRYQRLRVALIRAPFDYSTEFTDLDIPVLMEVVLISEPEYFDEHLAAFERLLGEIVFNQRSRQARSGLELLEVLSGPPEEPVPSSASPAQPTTDDVPVGEPPPRQATTPSEPDPD